MKHCPDPSCPFAKKHGTPSEFRDEIEVCADCGGPLVAGAAPSPVRADEPSPAHGPPWKALIVTILVVAAPLVATWVPLPGLDAGELERLDRAGWHGFVLSPFMLGVAPALYAFGVVELVALAVPRWRALRHGGLAGRAMLLRATMLVALALAIFQGWTQARFLEGADFLAGTGIWPLLCTTFTLAAGTFVWIGLAALADRHALLGGYSLLIASGVAQQAIDAMLDTQAKLASGQATPSELPLAALGFGAAAAVTAWLLSRKRARGELRVPASGISPILASASLLMLPYTLRSYGIRGFEGLHLNETAHKVAVAGALALLFAWLFNLPKNVARFSGEGIDVARPLVRGALFSVAFVVGLAALGAFLVRATPVHIGIVTIASAVAIVLDIHASWRAHRRHGDLVAVRPEHRVYAVDAALDALAHAGIPAHARGVHHRTLWQFFGPFLPIVFFVPRDCVDDAARILSRVLDDTPARRGSPYRSEA